MNENLTDLVFILDRSGSMRGREQDTIGGFNGMIEKQKALAGEARVTTVLFDSVSKVLYSRASLRDVKPLTEKEYYAHGSTALLDAVGTAIDVVGAQLRDTAEAERPAKVIVIITTDGEENSSREYSLEQVKENGNFCSSARTSTPSARRAAWAFPPTERRATPTTHTGSRKAAAR